MENAELPPAERDIAKMLWSVIEFAAVVSNTVLALLHIEVEQGLGLFDPGQCQVMGLDQIPVVLHHEQIEAGAVQNADDDYGEDGHAPEKAHQDRGRLVSML